MEENKKATISVVINTYNAERILDKCLESVKEADEIVICDMHSTDRTIEIAQNFGCKIVYHEKCPIVEPARNYAMSQATSDYILILDADELVTPDLWEYLHNFANNPPKDTTALEIPRETYCLGQKLRSMYQFRLRRFWKNGACEYTDFVHVPPIMKEGKSTYIHQRKNGLAIQHYHIESIQSYLEKTNRYTDMEMARFKEKGKKFCLCRLIFRPLFEFFKFYILKGGFLDGICGLIICSMNMNYKFIQLAKLYEMEYKEKNPDKIY